MMSESVSPEMVVRIRALCKAIQCNRNVVGVNGHGVVYEAGQILNELPEPIDPDLIEARKIGEAAHYNSDSLNEQLLLAAIKRGRELATSA